MHVEVKVLSRLGGVRVVKKKVTKRNVPSRIRAGVFTVLCNHNVMI